MHATFPDWRKAGSRHAVGRSVVHKPYGATCDMVGPRPIVGSLFVVMFSPIIESTLMFHARSSIVETCLWKRLDVLTMPETIPSRLEETQRRLDIEVEAQVSAHIICADRGD